MLASCAVCLAGVVASEDFTPQYIVAFGFRATGAVEPARFRCVSFTPPIPPGAQRPALGRDPPATLFFGSVDCRGLYGRLWIRQSNGQTAGLRRHTQATHSCLDFAQVPAVARRHCRSRGLAITQPLAPSLINNNDSHTTASRAWLVFNGVMFLRKIEGSF